MKILHLISSNGLYGAERVVVELCKGFRRTVDAWPIVGAISGAGQTRIDLLEEARTQGIDTKTFLCRAQFDFATVKAIREFVKRNAIDIVHCHGYKSNFYGLLAAKNRASIVTTNHNWLRSHWKLGVYCFLDSLWIRLFDKVVAVSDDIAADMLRHHVPEGKIAVVDNGIDFERFNNLPDGSVVRRQLGIAGDVRIVGTIGSLKPAKGHEYLLHAAREIIRKNMDVKFLIVGDGYLRNQLDELAIRLGIRESVIFPGYRMDVPELLSAMDIFVLPSVAEGLPMVLLEAMAASRPVLASSVGAIPKIIESEKTGVLVPPANVAELEAALSSLLGDNSKAKRIADAGCERVRKDFSSEIMCARYLDVYRSVMNDATSWVPTR